MRAAEGVLGAVRMTAAAWKRTGIAIGDAGGWHTAAELLARQDLTLQQVSCMPPGMPERISVPGNTQSSACANAGTRPDRGLAHGRSDAPQADAGAAVGMCRSPVLLSTLLTRAW